MRLQQARLFFSIAVVTGLSACLHPKNLIYRDTEHFSLRQAGLTNTVVAMDLKLYNPNNYKLKLKRTGIDVYVNDQRLGNILLQHEYLLPRHDTFLLPVLLKIDVANAASNAWQLFTVKKEVNLRLSGSVRAGRHGLFINVPVSYEGRQVIR